MLSKFEAKKKKEDAAENKELAELTNLVVVY
jgi:hypothetical protein